MTAPLPAMTELDTAAFDALAMLAQLHLEFDRADSALVLLSALALLRPELSSLQRARCVAMLRTERNAELLAAVEPLLAQATDAESRPLLHILATAAWRLGDEAKARSSVARLRALGGVGRVPA